MVSIHKNYFGSLVLYCSIANRTLIRRGGRNEAQSGLNSLAPLTTGKTT